MENCCLPICCNVLYGFYTIKIVPREEQWTPLPEIEKHIEARLREKPMAFDGVAWKLWKSSFDFVSGELVLEIGVGKYSQYKFTNRDKDLRKMHPEPTLWFNGIDIGGITITSDEKIYFSKRPDDAQQSPGRWDIPCGQPSGLEELPSDRNLFRALSIVLERDIGFPVKLLSYWPLIKISEEPNWDTDLIFVLRIAETSQEIKEKRNPAKPLSFADCSLEGIISLLESETNLSRPTPLSLAYFLRQRYGDSSFSRFCYNSKV